MKPYSVTYQSGIGEGNKTTRFATLSEAAEYVKGRWQGRDYMDSTTCWHNDYGHFHCKGFTLLQIGRSVTHGDGWVDFEIV